MECAERGKQRPKFVEEAIDCSECWVWIAQQFTRCCLVPLLQFAKSFERAFAIAIGCQSRCFKKSIGDFGHGARDDDWCSLDSGTDDLATARNGCGVL